MWTVLKLLAVLSATLVAGSNDPVYMDAGSELPLTVMTFNRTVERCYIITPKGEEVEFYPQNNTNSKYKDTSSPPASLCSVLVTQLESIDSGEWILRLVANNGTIFDNGPHNIVVTGASEPEDPEETENDVEYLDEIIYNTPWGTSQQVSITTSILKGFISSCHLISPNGEEYTVTSDLEAVGIDVIIIDNQECAVTINVTSYEVIGDWTLFTKETRFSSNNVERRLNFTIYVEEFVDASPNEITIARGGIMHFRLSNPIDNPDTCVVIGPQGNLCRNAVRDTNNKEYCAFTLPAPPHRDQGIWEIRYGNKIVHRAPVNVTILDHETSSSSVFLTLGESVNITVGPETAAYCILRDHNGNTMFDGFGNCRLVISRVAYAHFGVWSMTVAVRGQVVTSERELIVVVNEAEPKPQVSTFVETDSEGNSVSILCSVSAPEVLRVCKLRAPNGSVVLPALGVGDERYSFYGNESTYDNGVYYHQCGLHIRSPVVTELGLWRCALDTASDTYYGFFNVPSPVNITDPETVAVIQTKPTLVAERARYDALVGETVSVLCSVQAPIQYCYFRATNGTVYNLTPGGGEEGSVTYWGGGLEAGECGARVRAGRGDAGAWRCVAGLEGGDTELRANFNLSVQEPMTVSQRNRGQRVVIEAQIHSSLTAQILEYCRFVRIDGLGFMSTNAPRGYFDASALVQGRCTLVANRPTMLDLHPWVVVAKVRGLEELVAVTDPFINDSQYSMKYNYTMLTAYILVGVLLTSILAALCFGSEKRRKSTRSTAVHVRDSFRRSWQRVSLKKNTHSIA